MISVWQEKIAKRFEAVTHYYPTEEELRAMETDLFVISQPLPDGEPKVKNVSRLRLNHFPLILRLHKALDAAGVPDRGRLAEIVAATGYSKPQVSRFLNGYALIPQHCLIAICRAFKLNAEFITGKDLKDSAIFQALEDEREKIPVTEGLDAPTQEVVNEMHRLPEKLRWVFVGEAKTIIEQMLQIVEAQNGEKKEYILRPLF